MSKLLRPKTDVRDKFPVPQLPEPSVKPQLSWASIKYGNGIENKDTYFFPDRKDVEGRYYYVEGRYQGSKNDTVLQLVKFEKAVKEAERHILVLDPHFDKIGVNVLGPALEFSKASDVRLLTSGGDIERNERERLRKMLTDYRNIDRGAGYSVQVQWTATLDKHRFPFLHDRFAIVDGALWHFGSTVGGGHPGLTAASGPWSATKTRAKEFFEECWSACNA